MKINLTKTTAKRKAIVFVSPNGDAQVVPCISGAFIASLIGAGVSLVGAKQERDAAEGMQARPLAPEEREIIDRMAELSKGDPELGARYAAISKRAMKGDYRSEGLEEDIEAEKAQREERIRGLGGRVSETAVEQGREYAEESADIVRGESRQEMMRLGEQLMSSRTARLSAQAGTSLGPLASHRAEKYDVETAKAGRKAGAKAGLVRTAASLASQYAAQKGGGAGTLKKGGE